MDAERFDLVVIGSGPAGEKGAAQAAYHGKRVALIERSLELGGTAVATGGPAEQGAAGDGPLRQRCRQGGGLRGQPAPGPGRDVRTVAAAQDRGQRADERHRPAQPGATRHRGGSRCGAPGARPPGPGVQPLGGTGAAGGHRPGGHRLAPPATIRHPLRRADGGGLRRDPRPGAGLRTHGHRRCRRRGLRVRLDLRCRWGPGVAGGPAGRASNVEGLGLEDVGVDVDSQGRVVVDEHYRTMAEHVYAAGDVIGPPPWPRSRWSRPVSPCATHSPFP